MIYVECSKFYEGKLINTYSAEFNNKLEFQLFYQMAKESGWDFINVYLKNIRDNLQLKTQQDILLINKARTV